MPNAINEALDKLADAYGYALVYKKPEDYMHTIGTVLTIDTFDNCKKWIQDWADTDARMQEIGIDNNHAESIEIVPVSRLHVSTRRAVVKENIYLSKLSASADE